MSANEVKYVARRYDIDALRVIAFSLLILYHVGMFYVADWHWHIKSTYTAEWLQVPMALVNKWRLPLLFLVSGLAVNFLLRRSTAAQFSWSRTRRLLIPLLFGMAVIIPPQAYIQALSNGAFSGSYIQFLAAYFTFQPWPPGAFDGSHIGVTWNHLWFLPYLLMYSLALAALLPLLTSPAGMRLRERFCALHGIRLVLLPAVPLAVVSWTLRSRFPETHDLITDWYNHGIYFTLFLYGYWIGTETGFWESVKAWRWSYLGVAVTVGAALLWFWNLRSPLPEWQLEGVRALEQIYAWCVLLAATGWAFYLLNRPFRWLAYANEAVYPWYVLHQTVTIIAGYHFAKYSLGPVLEPALVVTATVLGCLLLHEFLIRRLGVLRPLFGLKPRDRTPGHADAFPLRPET